MLPDKIYNVLKWLALIFLPASAAFYALMADTWNLPYGNQITITINGFGLFLGACLGISTLSYNKSKNDEEEHR